MASPSAAWRRSTTDLVYLVLLVAADRPERLDRVPVDVGPAPRELTVQKRSAPRCCCADRPDRGAGSRSCTGATQIPGTRPTQTSARRETSTRSAMPTWLHAIARLLVGGLSVLQRLRKQSDALSSLSRMLPCSTSTERGMEAFYDGPGLSCPARSSRPPRAPRSCTSRRRPRPRELTVQKGELFVLQSRAGKRSAPRCCCADRPDRGAGSRSCTGATQIPGPAQRRRLRGGRRLHTISDADVVACNCLRRGRRSGSSMQASAEPRRPEEADHPLNVAALAVARDGRGYFSLTI